MTTEKKTRTPRNVDSILTRALALPLSDRVKLRNALSSSIEAELKSKEEELRAAKEIVNGVQH